MPLAENGYYKIRQRDKFVKVQIIKVNTTTIVVKEGKKQRKIVTADINEIKMRAGKKVEMPRIAIVEYFINGFEVIGLATLLVVAAITEL